MTFEKGQKVRKRRPIDPNFYDLTQYFVLAKLPDPYPTSYGWEGMYYCIDTEGNQKFFLTHQLEAISENLTLQSQSVYP